ncbi:MAG TPA: cyanobacterial phytochrome A, partial [Deltaproteobacteria bacterium]|nr:cyanobacterial phytochrome A [Deltaproteobacteria bacterium]
ATFLLEDYGDKFGTEVHSKLETMKSLSNHMGRLIESLLHYSRVGWVDLAVEEVDLNESLKEVLDSLDFSLKERNIILRIPRPLPKVYCDRARVGEVFSNLISNASKYNDKPDKWIEIGFEEHMDHGYRLPTVFFVRDNGIGIQEKHIESIFRIFKRLHVRNEFGGGAGAGLTIVKKIVERHGGWIRVESQYGQGTTFYFTLEKDGGS